MTAPDHTSDRTFDIVVIGGGPGGYATALRASELGLSVALVERDRALGGVCLNRGCIPSKALITATHAMTAIRDSERMGIHATLEKVDADRLRAYQQEMVSLMTQGVQSLLSARNVTVVHGVASIAETGVVLVQQGEETADKQGQVGVSSVNDTTINANSADSTSGNISDGKYATSGARHTLELHASDIVLATGSRPQPFPAAPFGGAVIDSTQALNAIPFPSSAIVIGSGAVAVEFASMWNQAGVDVTMLIRGERVLSGWHRRTSLTLTRALSKSGITVLPHTAVTSASTDDSSGEAVIHYRSSRETDESSELELRAQTALVAIGRTPVTGMEWLNQAGVTRNEDGTVITDELGRTNAPHVWAVGDITSGPSLAYRAYEQGIIVAETIAGLCPKPLDDRTVPQVVFSAPEAASVGLTLDDAERNGFVDARETVYPVMGNARMRMSDAAGSMALISGALPEMPDVPVVLGVHMVAPGASDLIAEAEQLVGNRIPVSQAARLIHPHPTFSEMLGETLLRADGRPLHTR